MVHHISAQHDAGFFTFSQLLGSGGNKFICISSWIGQLRQHLNPSRWVSNVLCRRHAQLLLAATDDTQAHAFFNGLTDASSQQRLLLTQVATNHQHGIAAAEIIDALTQPQCALLGCIQAEVLLTHAGIDAVHTQTSSQLLGKQQFFNG